MHPRLFCGHQSGQALLNATFLAVLFATFFVATVLVDVVDGFRFDLQAFPAEDDPFKVLAAKDDSIWMTVRNKGLALKFDKFGKRVAEVVLNGYPQYVAESHEGDLLFSLARDGMIAKVSPDGSEVAKFPVGTDPMDLAVDNDGNIWVTLLNENAVVKIDKKGQLLFRKSINRRRPIGITIDRFNNAWIASTLDNVIIKMDPMGNLLGDFPSGGSVPETVAADSFGGIWVYNGGQSVGGRFIGKLVRLSATGSITATFETERQNTQFHIDATGNFWMTDSAKNTVMKMSEQGQTIEVYAISERGPVSVTTDSRGNIWVAAALSTSLVKFRPLEVTMFREISAFSFLKLDVNGHIWVFSAVGQTLTKFDSNGNQLVTMTIALPLNTVHNPSSFIDDKKGHMWISQQSIGGGSVAKIEYSGNVVGSFSVGSNPSQLVMDLQGDIYVDCTHESQSAVWKLKQTGELLTKIAMEGFEVQSMAIDTFNNLRILTTDGSLLTFNPTGSLVEQFTLGTFWMPLSMVLDETGNAWVLWRDFQNDNVRATMFPPSNMQVLINFPVPVVSSQGIFILDSTGNFWTDDLNERIVRFSKSGEIRAKYSTARFGRPRSLSIDKEGSVWITTTESNRLVKLSSILETEPIKTFSPSEPTELAPPPLPTQSENHPGMLAFLALLIISFVIALLLFLMEYQRLREARLFLAAIRVRDRLLFRLKTKQDKANVRNEMPASVPSMFLNVLKARAQHEVLLIEVHTRIHLDRSEIDRAMLAIQLALFSLVFSYNMSSQGSNVVESGGVEGSIPSATVAPESDYFAIADVAEISPETINLARAESKIASALDKLVEGTNGSYDKAAVNMAEKYAIDALNSLPKFSLDSSKSNADILAQAQAGENTQWTKNGQKFRNALKQCIGLLPRFVTSKDDRLKRRTCRTCFPRFAQFPWFYGLFVAFIISIFLSFAAKVDRTNAGMDANDRVPPGLSVGNLPFLLGGYGQTFLPMPPQYNLTARPAQASGVPFLYGVMHCVMFFLGLLPVPFMRGFWRDVVKKFPNLRQVMPIDDFTFFHRLCAWLALSGLLLGCFIWLATLGMECAFRNQPQACLAFDTSNGNPVDNVLMLRFIVWATWFPIMPLMYYVRRGPWKWLPKLIKRFYFEIIYCLHLITAFGTVILALVCRFTVFYPALVSWVPYFLDWFREIVFHTHKVAVNETQVKWFSSINDQKPTSVRLSFTHRVTKNSFGAGQWMYLMIPSIDYNWHPFSIASASKDHEIELHIGVIAPGIAQDAKAKQWTMPQGTETWTFRLWQLIQKPESERCFNAYIRGPYGTAFSSCFSPDYHASIVIGAGTGLTAAESVLREIVHMRKSNQPTPSFTWFVWSCRRVDDVMWCWDTLIDLIYDCCNAGLMDFNLISNRPSDAMNVFDWLGIAIFVTQATEKELKEFISFRPSRRTTEHKKIEEWLFNQIVAGALDDEDTHVRKLLQGVRQKLIVSGYARPKMTVSFCGPSTLANTIAVATQQLGGTIEFSSDNQ